MSENLRSWADRLLTGELLPTLNIAVLLIPVIAMAMQLGSAAANLVTATSPTDVAELETPPATQAPAEPSRIEEDPRSATPASRSGPSAPARMPQPIGDRSLADPLLGYGI